LRLLRLSAVVEWIQERKRGEDLLLSYEPMKEGEKEGEGKVGEKAKREVCDGLHAKLRYCHILREGACYLNFALRTISMINYGCMIMIEITAVACAVRGVFSSFSASC
jgi:hypothetical protein